VNLVNQTWEKRDEIEPDTEMHPRRQPLELYRLLPQTNCKRCGQETCFAFALKLAAAHAEAAQCAPLYEEQAMVERRTQLLEILATKWPTL
jgi:ArsR family metal-binding transcriptional regulator